MAKESDQQRRDRLRREKAERDQQRAIEEARIRADKEKDAARVAAESRQQEAAREQAAREAEAQRTAAAAKEAADRAERAKVAADKERQAQQAFAATLGAIGGGYALGTALGKAVGKSNAKDAARRASAIVELAKRAETTAKSKTKLTGTRAGDRAAGVVGEARAQMRAKPGQSISQAAEALGRPRRGQFAVPGLLAVSGVASIATSFTMEDGLAKQLVRAEGVASTVAGLAMTKSILGSGQTTPRPSASAMASVAGLEARLEREAAEKAAKDLAKVNAAAEKAAKVQHAATLRATPVAALKEAATEAGIKGAASMSKASLVSTLIRGAAKAVPVIAATSVALAAVSAGAQAAEKGKSPGFAAFTSIIDNLAPSIIGFAIGGPLGLAAGLVATLGIAGMHSLSEQQEVRQKAAEAEVAKMSPAERETAADKAAAELASAEAAAFGGPAIEPPAPAPKTPPPSATPDDRSTREVDGPYTRAAMAEAMQAAMRDQNETGPVQVEAHRRIDGDFVRAHTRARVR